MKLSIWSAIYTDRGWTKALAIVTAGSLLASTAWAQSSGSGGGGAAGSGGLGSAGSGSGSSGSGSLGGGSSSGGALSGHSSGSSGDLSDSSDIGSSSNTGSGTSGLGDTRVQRERRQNLDSSASGGRSGSISGPSGRTGETNRDLSSGRTSQTSDYGDDDGSDSSSSTDAASSGDRFSGSDRGQSTDRDRSSRSRQDALRQGGDQGNRSARSGRDNQGDERASTSRRSTQNRDQDSNNQDQDDQFSSDDSNPQGRSSSERRTGRLGRNDQEGRSQARTQGQQGQSRQASSQSLGLSFDDADDQLVVSDVRSGGLASRIGLEDGDEILSVNGRRISSEREFYSWVNQAPVGQRIPIEVYRDGSRETVYWSGQLQGAQGGQFGSNQANYNQEGHAFLGVQLDQRFPNAAVVSQVYQNSPAQQAGLRPGDWIISLNGQRVQSSQDLTQEVSQLEPGVAVQIQISRPSTRNLQVRLGDRQDSSTTTASFQEESQSTGYPTGERFNDRQGSSRDDRSSRAGSVRREGRRAGESSREGGVGDSGTEGESRSAADYSDHQGGDHSTQTESAEADDTTEDDDAPGSADEN